MTIRYLEATRELVVHLKFPDSRKDEVKALGARFNGTDKGWYLRADLDAARVARLEALGFVMPPEWLAVFGGPPDTGPVSAMLAETIAIERPLRGKTMSELASDLKSAVSRAVPESIWVRGSFRPNNSIATNAGFFFAIAEVDAAGRDSVTLQACVWASELERVMRPLRNAGLELTNGLAICARVKVSLSERRGQVMLSVQEFDPAASLGEIALQRDKVLRAIAAEGLTRMALDRPLPLLPMRIALVSSVGTDGYTDFRKQLSESGYGFAVTDFDVRVQGDALERTVLEAFSAIESQRDRFDLVVVTRGGGGKGDLGSWDNLAVGRAVARCSVKVLVAIGHVNDATSLDSIALSLPTPTAAGKFVAERVTQADERAADAFSAITAAVFDSLAQADSAIDGHSDSVVRSAEELLLDAEERLTTGASNIAVRVSGLVRLASERLLRFERALGRAPSRLRAASSELERAGQSVARGAERLIEQRRSRQLRAGEGLGRAARSTVQRAEQRLKVTEVTVRMADPATILRRGFALLRDESGAVLTSTHQVMPGAALTVELRDGRLTSRVESVEPFIIQTPSTETEP
jgi:exodeoxyribonuclease VII large subunit